jgi:hypothetical protein
MVIHHPGGLHMGIDICWPNKMRSILMMVVVILALGFTPASFGLTNVCIRETPASMAERMIHNLILSVKLPQLIDFAPYLLRTIVVPPFTAWTEDHNLLQTC